MFVTCTDLSHLDRPMFSATVTGVQFRSNSADIILVGVDPDSLFHEEGPWTASTTPDEIRRAINYPDGILILSSDWRVIAT